MNKLQEMRQQLERDEKRRQRKVLLLLFLWLIAILGGMVLVGWLWALNFYLAWIPASLAFIAWLVYCLIKGIKTGVFKGSSGSVDCRPTQITRKDDPARFWVVIYFYMCIVSGLLFWLCVDPLQKLITDGWGGLAQ
jgi:xanthine/uracil permease